METVIIAGGSGLIGKEIQAALKKRHIETAILTRKPTNIGAGLYHWNPAKGIIDDRVFDRSMAIINLAGSRIIGKRWTPSVKRNLYDSRINSTRFLVHTINRLEVPLKHFIQASAMGYYGDRGTQTVNEDDGPGDDFLSKLCVDWEQQSEDLDPRYKRSIMRIGLYLSPHGGVYATLAKLARWKVLSRIGNKGQYTNYTHRDELNALICKIIHHEVPEGIYNVVGPKPITMDQMVEAIAKRNNSPLWLPRVPAWAVRIVMGEASSTLLNSTAITSKSMKEWDLHKYKTLADALSTL